MSELEELEQVLTAYVEAVETAATALRRFETVDLAMFLDTPVLGPIVVVELERRHAVRLN
jgi:hypothetical protein